MASFASLRRFAHCPKCSLNTALTDEAIDICEKCFDASVYKPTHYVDGELMARIAALEVENQRLKFLPAKSAVLNATVTITYADGTQEILAIKDGEARKHA